MARVTSNGGMMLTGKLARHPMILQSTLQSFLCRIMIVAKNQDELATWHLCWWVFNAEQAPPEPE